MIDGSIDKYNVILAANGLNHFIVFSHFDAYAASIFIVAVGFNSYNLQNVICKQCIWI